MKLKELIGQEVTIVTRDNFFTLISGDRGKLYYWNKQGVKEETIKGVLSEVIESCKEDRVELLLILKNGYKPKSLRFVRYKFEVCYP